MELSRITRAVSNFFKSNIQILFETFHESESKVQIVPFVETGIVMQTTKQRISQTFWKYNDSFISKQSILNLFKNVMFDHKNELNHSIKVCIYTRLRIKAAYCHNMSNFYICDNHGNIWELTIDTFRFHAIYIQEIFEKCLKTPALFTAYKKWFDKNIKSFSDGKITFTNSSPVDSSFYDIVATCHNLTCIKNHVITFDMPMSVLVIIHESK